MFLKIFFPSEILIDEFIFWGALNVFSLQNIEFFVQGLQCVSYSMIMELFCPAYRTLAGCVAEAFWAGGEKPVMYPSTIHLYCTVHLYGYRCTRHWLAEW